jgi:hypothetical protein
MVKVAVISVIILATLLRFIYETWDVGFDAIKLLTVQ